MRLLLVEDERDLSSTIKRVLELNKYEVDVAYDGIQALERIHAQGPYDLVILDVMMPRLNGYQTVSRLRDEGNDVPVLMLTAKAEIDDMVLGLDSGADDYMTKPFQIKELLARIRALTRRKEDLKKDYTFEDLTLDHNTYELRAKSSVHLTNQEYRLVELLMKNTDKVIATEEIMKEAWKDGTLAEINVVWAYISALRKKLKEIGSTCVIEASRGVGYRLSKK